MKLIAFFFLIALFVVLTPGIFLTLPKKTSGKWMIALTHGVIFAILWFIIQKPVAQINYRMLMEGNTGMTPSQPVPGKKPSDKAPSA